MKKVLFFLTVLFFAANLFAQNGNDRISYQAVVRNSENRLVHNEELTVTVTITNVPDGPVVYSETHAVTSNANGLISLLVGNGTDHTGNWNDIQWKTARLSTRIEKAGNHELVAAQDMPLTAVPYARYADYADSVNSAAIAQQIHDTASALRGLIKDTDDRFGNYYTKPQADDLLGAKADTAILAKVAKTGSYSDLGDKPEINNATLTLKQGDDTLGTFTANASANQDIEIPAVPANVSAFINDAGYLTSYTEIQTLADVTAADADITYTGKQARWYGNDSATCVTNNYGLLYNWNAAVDTFNTAKGETSVNDDESNAVSATFTGHRRGICPAGWHLPSDAEWTAMTDYVGSQSEYTCGGISSYIAKVLASTEGWNTSSGNCTVGNDLAANNATGFSAVPAGLCYGSLFHYAGSHAYFWSATQNEDDPYLAYYRNLYYDYKYVFMYYDSKYLGFSVRCLRD